jgi:hypothetical protein
MNVYSESRARTWKRLFDSFKMRLIQRIRDRPRRHDNLQFILSSRVIRRGFTRIPAISSRAILNSRRHRQAVSRSDTGRLNGRSPMIDAQTRPDSCDGESTTIVVCASSSVSGFFEAQHDFNGFFVFDDFRVSGVETVSLDHV